MKKMCLKILFLSALITYLSNILYSQTGKFINYQAVVRDAAGKPISDQNLVITVSVYRDSIAKITDLLYQESFNSIAIKSGLVNVAIGKGEKASFGPGFETLNWNIEKPFYVKIDYPGLGISSPLKQLGSVPYALSANSEWKNNGDTSLYTTKKYVGIGIQNPSEPLEVQKTILISSNAFPNLFFRDRKNIKYFELDSGNHFYLFDKINKRYDFIVYPSGYIDFINSIGLASRIYIGKNGTENNYSLVHFKNGTKQHGGIIRASIDDDDVGNAPMKYEALSHEFTGIVSVPILEIRGGSDITEMFQSDEKMEPGDVVSIDPNNSGKIIKSQKPYDQNVIGVVSGAGGINSGLQLSQAGVTDGNIPIALLGRVKVKVSKEVKPGDILTSSHTKGEAMKLVKFKKLPGIIIGKVLSYFEKEKMALIIVSHK